MGKRKNNKKSNYGKNNKTITLKDLKHGNIAESDKFLLNYHGVVDRKKTEDSILYRTGLLRIDVDLINEASKEACLMLDRYGEAYNLNDKIAEEYAKYKIVPIGYTSSGGYERLYASFMRLNVGWEGAYIGTLTQLTRKAMEYEGRTEDEIRNSYVAHLNDYVEIKGNGLKEIRESIQKDVKNLKNTMQDSYETDLDSLVETDDITAIEESFDMATENEQGLLDSNEKVGDTDLNIQLDNTVDNVYHREPDEIDLYFMEREEEQTEVTGKHVYTKEQLEFLKYAKENLDDEWGDIDLDEFYDHEEEVVGALLVEIENSDVSNEAYEDEQKKSVTSNKIKKNLKENLKVGTKQGEIDLYTENIIMLNNLYNRLLMKESWRSNDKNRLAFYMKSLFIKIRHEQSKSNSNTGNGYVTTPDKQKCLINTGLLDNYTNDIYILDKTNNVDDFLSKDLEIVSSKVKLVGQGFEPKDVRFLPKPCVFYNNKSELIFSGDINDFDLDDSYRINHIINERRSRFPDKFKNTPSEVLCDALKLSIKKALKVAERDYKYIIPMYNLKRNRIQYLMPLYFDSSYEEAPELAIVIGRDSGFWCVYTILEVDTAYDNARLIAKPDGTWLKAIKETKYSSNNNYKK